MYFNKRLIFSLFLAGCTAPVADKSLDYPVEESLPVITLETDSLLQSVESTLEVADQAIEEIKTKKKSTSSLIRNLKKVVDEDLETLSTLEQKLAEKDNLIKSQSDQIKIIKNQIAILESLLEETKYNSKYEKKLLIKENKILKEEISKLTVKIEYLDSLVQTNRRLRKLYKY